MADIVDIAVEACLIIGGRAMPARSQSFLMQGSHRRRSYRGD